MPLPPRDLLAVHLSLNPSLAELHKMYPLSRYAPAVALFRLYKLSFEGCPLVAHLDITSWMTLACLDDQSGDYCIGCAVAVWHHSGGNRVAMNAAFVHAAAPFMVPMLVQVPCLPTGAWITPAVVPTKAPMPTPHLVPAAAATKQPADSATSAAGDSASTTAESTAVSTNVKSSVSPSVKLHVSVLRVIHSLIKDSRGKVGVRLFDGYAYRLQRLSSSAACKALREFAGELRRAASNDDHGKLLSNVLIKYETMEN